MSSANQSFQVQPLLIWFYTSYDEAILGMIHSSSPLDVQDLRLIPKLMWSSSKERWGKYPSVWTWLRFWIWRTQVAFQVSFRLVKKWPRSGNETTNTATERQMDVGTYTPSQTRGHNQADSHQDTTLRIRWDLFCDASVMQRNSKNATLIENLQEQQLWRHLVKSSQGTSLNLRLT